MTDAGRATDADRAPETGRAPDAGRVPDPHRASRPVRTLAGRILLTTVAVAAVAVLVSAIVGFQLVRQVSVEQSRTALRTELQGVAIAPVGDRTRFAALVERRSGGRVDVGFVRAGRVTGLVRPLPARALREIEATGRASVRIRAGLDTELVEAVRERSGGTVVGVQDVSILRGTAWPIIWRFLVALGIGVLVAAGLGVGVARLVGRPLRRVAADARRLAAGARGIAPQPPTDIAEVDGIAAALVTLDSALSTSEGRQRDFLLSISHELRTPLTAIRGYADAFADGLVPAADVSRIGAVLGAETQRLDAFVGDLLELARLEADDFRIRPADVELGALVASVAAAWSGRAATIGATVRTGDGTAAVTTRTDAMRVRQLLDGLVENALRASPPGGVVDLTVRRAAGRVVLTVSDQGPGLGAADRDVAFVRGALADRHRADRIVGTGLGLSIAARLAGRLGGGIRTIEAPVGAVFEVWLPA